ncbi:MAG: hypothetical protein Q9169_002411 [Polycauliona sp. 2 TL-2023]
MLAQCIKSSKIARISVLSRRPVKQAEGLDKVKVHIHQDFHSYPDSLLSELKGAVGCIWALGISTSQVKAEFTLLFARVKGEAETSLLALRSDNPGLRIWNVRPGFIDESQNPLKDGPDMLTKKLAFRIAPLFRNVWPNGVSPTGLLAELSESCVLEEASKEDVKARIHGTGVTIEEGDTLGVLLANTGIRRLAASYELGVVHTRDTDQSKQSTV